MPRTWCLTVWMVLVPVVVLAGEIRGTVIDADTKQPLPCRLYVQTAEGQWLFARSAEAQGSAIQYDVQRTPLSVEKHVTLSAHSFVVDAAGPVTITVELGKEYHPLVTKAEPGQTVELALKRWIDMPSHGWYSGDTHVHRKPEEMANVMPAEDLHVTFPLTYWVREAYKPASQGALSGELKPELVQVAPNRVYWPINTEYELFTVAGKPHTQGAVFVLNHKRPLDVAAPPSLPVATAAREQGGLLDLDKHSWNWSLMIVPIMKVDLFELSNNHVWRTNFLYKTWTLDVVPKDWDIERDEHGLTEWGWMDWGFKTYYAFLNCGFRMRPTGGTASGVHPVPVGFGRVYVHVDGEFTYEKWLQGLNHGRSFVTTGPMLTLQMNGQPTGAVFTGEPARTVLVKGAAESRLPLDRIEVIVNGDIVRTIKPGNTQTKSGGYTSLIEANIPLEHSAWVAVRCFEKQPDGRQRFAHTAPSHFEIDGPVTPRQREVQYFLDRMDQEIARNRGVLTDADLAEYEQARKIYAGFQKQGRLCRP